MAGTCQALCTVSLLIPVRPKHNQLSYLYGNTVFIWPIEPESVFPLPLTRHTGVMLWRLKFEFIYKTEETTKFLKIHQISSSRLVRFQLTLSQYFPWPEAQLCVTRFWPILRLLFCPTATHPRCHRVILSNNTNNSKPLSIPGGKYLPYSIVLLSLSVAFAITGQWSIYNSYPHPISMVD